MTTTGDTSNECVGDPRTPLCALETWSACILWGEPSLYEKVGLDGQQFRENESDFFEWEHTFRQITTRTVDAVHLSGIEAGEFAALRPEQTWFRPGYIEIRWTEQVCAYPDNEDCLTYDGEAVLIVKPAGDDWHISGWRYEATDATCRNYVPARDDPWGRGCSLHISSEEFADYEASRSLAE